MERLVFFQIQRRNACVALNVSDEELKEVKELAVNEMVRCHEKMPTVSLFFVDFEEYESGEIQMTSNLISTEDATHIVKISAKALSVFSQKYSNVRVVNPVPGSDATYFKCYETYKDHRRIWHFEYML